MSPLPMPARLMLRTGLAAAALLAVTWVQAQPGPDTPSDIYLCHRATSPILVDGRLDEPAWRAAQKLQDFKVPPTFDWATLRMSQPLPAISQTVARLVWDDQCLYLGVELADKDLYGESEGHDPPFAAEDVVELFVKPSAASPRYMEFHITPRAATRDYFYPRRGAGGDSRWKPYESGMMAAVQCEGSVNHWEDEDRGWVVEMAVPLRAFDWLGGNPQIGDRWTFMVSRYDYSVYLEAGVELSASAPLPQQNFHLYEFYQPLEFAQ